MRIIYRFSLNDKHVEIEVEDDTVRAEETAKVDRLIETVHRLAQSPTPPHGVNNLT